MYLPKFYHSFTLLLCSFCLVSCNKETEKPATSVPYFILNDSTFVSPNSGLSISAGCKEYNIEPRSVPEGNSIFVSINDNDFTEFQNPTLLHDSIYKISAYAIQPAHQKSPVVSLSIDFESNIFAHTTTLYPNPASDHITLRAENPYRGLTKFTCLDAWGEIQYTSETEKVSDIMELTVDVSEFSPGLYIYRLEYEACLLTGKFIVES